MTKLLKFLGVLIFWIGWPAFYLILRKSHRSRVIINVDEKVLFVRSFIGPNSLELPGGGVKGNEIPAMAAIRELQEETGLIVSENELKIITRDMSLSEAGITYKADIFMVTLQAEVPIKSRNIEIIESLWLPWRDYIDTKKLSRNTNNILHAWLE